MFLTHAVSKNQIALTEQPTYNALIRTFNRSSDAPITLERINDYFALLKEKRYRPSTLHCAKAALKAGILRTFPDMANDIRFRSSLDTAFRGIRCGRADKTVHKEKLLSEDEISKMVDGTPYWLSLIIECLSVSALRISELTCIKHSDITVADKKKAFVTVIGKGYRERRIILSLELLARISRAFNGKTYLFENSKGKPYCRKFLWREVHKHGKRILGRSISNHCFRHSWATNSLIHKGKSLKAVSTYLGHHSVTLTSSVYIWDEIKYEDLFEEVG